MKRDWLIVGGGLHGAHIARRLAAADARLAVAVIDPQPTALTHWATRADNCGMHFLRSPQVHHMGLRADALRTFAREHGYDGRNALGRYRRPSRALFEAHCHEVFEPVKRIADAAVDIHHAGTGWTIHTRSGHTCSATNVVLACGPAGLARPDWGEELPHVLDASNAGTVLSRAPGQHTVVVGGGLSAAQYAIACAKADGDVTLLSRHRLQQAGFDSDPCFAGRLCLEPFRQLPMAERSPVLDKARNPGTLPGDIYTELMTHLADASIRWTQGTVQSLTDAGPKLTDGRCIVADRVVLATGFCPGAHPFVEHVAQSLQLSLDRHGYAGIDTHLAWAPHLYVTGRSASLQLGAMAGNLRGAQLAGKCLAEVAKPASLDATTQQA